MINEYLLSIEWNIFNGIFCNKYLNWKNINNCEINREIYFFHLFLSTSVKKNDVFSKSSFKGLYPL